MNTNHSFNRKAALQQSIAHGKSMTKSVAPAEFLSLVAYTDPLNFDRGVHLLADQIGVKETDIRTYQRENECYEASLESMRNAFSTDPVRMKLSQFKYESGLIPDDEILAFVLFLVADSDLVEYASATGEVEFDDLADLLNHMANRARFLLMCLREGRFDILNAVVQFARKYKSEQIDTIFCFDKVEPDDGGLADYYKAMTDHDAFAALNDNLTEDDFDDGVEYDDKLDGYDRDDEEPAVERDFEG